MHARLLRHGKIKNKQTTTDNASQIVFKAYLNIHNQIQILMFSTLMNEKLD